MSQHGTFNNLERLSSTRRRLFLQGAHLTRFHDWLFAPDLNCSCPASRFMAVCPSFFPWFGANTEHPDAPMHGFARTANWSVDEASEAGFRLSLNHETATHEAWPFAFGATLRFDFSDQLRMRLEIENRDTKPFRFECAFHTYFAVDDISRVKSRVWMVWITSIKRAISLAKRNAEL
jgi:D-hexose-6-phosphate mutarotase